MTPLIEDPPPGYPFDGITETPWFANTEDAVRSLADGTLVPVAQDLPAFCDRERSVTLPHVRDSSALAACLNARTCDPAALRPLWIG